MRRMPQPYAMLISIMLVPLLLGMLGCWELVRAQGSVVDYAVAVVSLPQQVREIRELGARDSAASVDLGNPDTAYAPALAADMVEARLPSVRRSLVLARMQGPLVERDRRVATGADLRRDRAGGRADCGASGDEVA